MYPPCLISNLSLHGVGTQAIAAETADKKLELFESLRERLKTFPGTEIVLIWVEKSLEQYAQAPYLYAF